MTKTKKRALILTILLAVVMILSSLAGYAGEGSSTEIPTPKGAPEGNTKDVVNTIVGYVQYIGVAVALIMLIIMGIKYVSAEADKKADIKEQAIVYIFGAFCIFAAVGLLQLVKNVSTDLSNAIKDDGHAALNLIKRI